MDQPIIAFTAIFLKSPHGYVDFIEELPSVNSHGRTLDEARVTLRKIAGVAFDEARREADELLDEADVAVRRFQEDGGKGDDRLVHRALLFSLSLHGSAAR